MRLVGLSRMLSSRGGLFHALVRERQREREKERERALLATMSITGLVCEKERGERERKGGVGGCGSGESACTRGS